MRLSYLFGGGLMLLGLALVAGPMVLPRPFFGEAGHGDGFGLLAIMLRGAFLIMAGVVVLVIAAVIEARRNANAPEASETKEDE